MQFYKQLQDVWLDIPTYIVKKWEVQILTIYFLITYC